MHYLIIPFSRFVTLWKDFSAWALLADPGGPCYRAAWVCRTVFS